MFNKTCLSQGFSGKLQLFINAFESQLKSSVTINYYNTEVSASKSNIYFCKQVHFETIAAITKNIWGLAHIC